VDWTYPILTRFIVLLSIILWPLLLCVPPNIIYTVISTFTKPVESWYSPLTLRSYAFASLINNAAASPFNGSAAFGYLNNCGRKTSKILSMSNMGLHVWLITSKQTDPDNSSMLAEDTALGP
jgi:hypothetical protein